MLTNRFKFRAWDKEDKRMIIDEQEFIPVKVTSKGVLKLNAEHEENFWVFADSERFILMQSTGCKDKNGKEIFEGDIFKDHYSKNKGVVTFGEYEHATKDDFAKHGSNIGFFVKWKSTHTREDLGYWKKYEVVGNIYENEGDL